MSSQSIQLTGWKAVVVGVLVVGAAGYRMVTARTTLDTQDRQALEQWVAGELRRGRLSRHRLPAEATPAEVPRDAHEDLARHLSKHVDGTWAAHVEQIQRRAMDRPRLLE